MLTKNGQRVPLNQIPATITSRRRALGWMLGACPWTRRALAASQAAAPVRLAISQSVVRDVNLNDARVAMQVWIKKMTQDLDIVIDLKLFATTQEIGEVARKGQLESAALNVIEYLQIAEMRDANQIVTAAGAGGLEKCLILARQSSGIRQLGGLRGRRIYALKNPNMCGAPAWLSNLLEEGHDGPVEQFFGSVSTDNRVS